MNQEDNKNWHNLDTKQVFEILDTDENGLSTNRAGRRLIKYGPNALPTHKKATLFKVFISQFINPIIFILLAAAFFSLLIGERIDTFFILIVILIDVIFGTFQEWKAEKSAESLQNLLKVKTRVLRNNREIEIDSEKVVPGDIVIVQSGDKVSADLRIIECHNLTVDESALTGESIPCGKKQTIMPIETPLVTRKNMLYAGSTVMCGRCVGVAVNTGLQTEIGKIAENVLLADDTKTPLVIRMENFTKQISFFVAIIAIILTFILYIKGYAPREIFFAVVALSVSAIPEGLPISLTIALSIATNRMAKKNVIVRKLNAVESLGSCTVIASDKTGTLTLNEQTAKIIELADGSVYEASEIGYHGNGEIIPINAKSSYKDSLNNLDTLCRLSILNNEGHLEQTNDGWKHHGDSIDVALLALGYKANLKPEIKNEYEVIGSIPYESEKKYSAVFYKQNNQNYVTVKGSIETLLNFCTHIRIGEEDKEVDKQEILNRNDALAAKGYRVIAIANGICDNFITKEDYDSDDIPNLTLIGLVGFIDPIRKESKEAIQKCYKAGIKVVMITGDHPLTAQAIATELQIIKNTNVVTGVELDKQYALGEEAFDKFVKKHYVFARVTPIQKLWIVESYKRQGEFIAVTGDGVNDAPALKSANIGIAMGSGTDVAKETSDMIITDDNFFSIVSGIEEGRYAYSNIRKVIYLLISCGSAEVLFFMLSVLFNLPMPLIAIQLLWLNLVTDGVHDMALACEGGEKNVMNEKPRNPNEKVFNKFLIQETMLSGFTIGMTVFLLWVYLINVAHLEITHARNYILLLMVFMQNVHTFNCRSEKQSAFKIPFKSNPLVVISVVITIILQLVVAQTPLLSDVLETSPLTLNEILSVFILSIPLLFVLETFKYFKRKKK